MDKNFINWLENRLNQPLPGLISQKKMAPLLGESEFRSFKAKPDAKDSAVLALMTLINDELNVMLTLRSSALKSHKGQISFPGGRREENEALEATAQRETYEETGIESSNYRILGKLSILYVPPSNSVIHPFIAFSESLPEIRINPDEVEEVFYIPLNSIVDEGSVLFEIKDINGWNVNVPYWEVNKKTKLWGATAMMLSEILELIREYRQQN